MPPLEIGLEDDGTPMDVLVERLFGVCSPALVSAVERFLAKDHSDIDRAYLAMIAAASKTLPDADMLAEVIDQTILVGPDDGGLRDDWRESINTTNSYLSQVPSSTPEARQRVLTDHVNWAKRRLLTSDSLSQKVERLFGFAPPVIVRAYAKFMERAPGGLDQINLAVIARAAPAIDDPQLVARLIDDLQITGMDMTRHVPDQALDREYFRQILTRYPKLLRQRLVADLVQRSTMDTISMTPIERRSEVGRSMLESYFAKAVKGSALDIGLVVRNDAASSEMIDAALNEVERRIGRSEAGTANRPPHKMPLEAIADVVSAVFESKNEAVSVDHVLRAWDITLRCEATEHSRTWVLETAVRNKLLTANAALSVISQIEHVELYASRLEFAEQLLARAELPEECAPLLCAVLRNDRANRSNAFQGDQRLLAVREEFYARHPLGGGRLPSSMTQEDLDLRYAELEPSRMNDTGVRSMSSAAALRRLSERSPDLSTNIGRELIRHPEVDFETAMLVYENFIYVRDRSGLSQNGVVELARQLLSHPHADAAAVDRVVEGFSGSDRDELEAFVRSMPIDPMDLAKSIISEQRPPDAVDRLIQQASDGSFLMHRFTTLDEQRAAHHKALQLLADHDLLTKQHWRKLTDDTDIDTAMLYATHPRCPTGASNCWARTDSALRWTIDAMENGHGKFPLARSSLGWNDLPDHKDEPFQHEETSNFIDGAIAGGLKWKVPGTPRELERLAAKMGNCLAGHILAVNSGDAVVAWATQDKRTFAAVWYKETWGFALQEINTDFNTGRVPAEIRESLAELTKHERLRRVHEATRAATTHVETGARATTSQREASSSTGAQVLQEHEQRDVGDTDVATRAMTSDAHMRASTTSGAQQQGTTSDEHELSESMASITALEVAADTSVAAEMAATTEATTRRSAPKRKTTLELKTSDSGTRDSDVEHAQATGQSPSRSVLDVGMSDGTDVVDPGPSGHECIGTAVETAGNDRETPSL